MTAVLQESQSFFDDLGNPKSSILPLQVDPSAPAITGLSTGTGLILPDRTIRWRMRHFPEDLYDLRDSSHLMRFMQALLGDAGAGQLRKRNLLAAFQTALDSTRFYDLDRFYGAIFGVQRFANEALWINPMNDVATGEEWDDIEARDAAYRARIFKLAAAINMGGTVPGLTQVAEAITQVDCDLYQSWTLIDTFGDIGEEGRTWDDMEEDFDTWDDVEDGGTWAEVENQTIIGRSGAITRSEVIIKPNKDYQRISDEDGPLEAARQKAEDLNGLLRVLNVVKPASVLITVDDQGVALHKPAHIAHLEADSNYWEVTAKVSPRKDRRWPTNETLDPYPLSARQIEAGVDYYDERVIPTPPLSAVDSVDVTYAAEVVTVSAYSFDAEGVAEPLEGDLAEPVNQGTVRYLDGVFERFTADRSLMDSARAIAARYSGDGVIVAHPYSGDRKAVPTHG